MSTATRDHPSGRLRVSDADRDRAIAELSEHYQAGRLTTEELDRSSPGDRRVWPFTWAFVLCGAGC
jgi:hypothetical protein